MFAEPEVLFGNLDELCCVRGLVMIIDHGDSDDEDNDDDHDHLLLIGNDDHGDSDDDKDTHHDHDFLRLGYVRVLQGVCEPPERVGHSRGRPACRQDSYNYF